MGPGDLRPPAGHADRVATPDHTQIPGSPFHPTFLYELIWNLLVAALVVYLDRKLRLGHGRAFALYVAGYTLGRCWIELMRTDPATMVFGVRINVWTSIIVFIGAVVYFVRARSRGEREDLAAIIAAHEGTAVAGPGDDAKPEPADGETGDETKDETKADETEVVAESASEDEEPAETTEVKASEDEPATSADKTSADKTSDEEAKSGK